MEIELEAGRWFTRGDEEDTRPVLVLNQTLADRLWPNEMAVGKQVRLFAQDNFAWEVVGVIADVKQMALSQGASGEIYLPHQQWYWGSMFVTVRTAGRPEALAPVVRQTIRNLGQDITITNVAAMDQVVGASVASDRFVATLLGAFGLLALVLGSAGVYGVVAFAVSRRIPEFGLRAALGSSQFRILSASMTQGLSPVALGVAVGLGASLGATRVLSALLFGVDPIDPVTYGTVSVLLILVAAGAAYLPSRRAWSVDPVAALRSE